MEGANSLDLVKRLADECEELYRILQRVRPHVEKLLDPAFRTGALRRAVEEQRTATQEMESAVDRIMNAVERMMALDFTNPEHAAAQVADCCGEIMEACCFQDITGQRLSQVTGTLGTVDGTLDALDDYWTGAAREPAAASLLNGPALPGNGLEQDAVDRLLATGRKAR
ncbi:hypothetical protein [Parvibaculum sp.]|uniref:hypothetical protein n=1 Tax=Parvibaculum sp. TaxID=2024848 RepID=UPI0027312A5F|nr:hypothetical protein [Parvibaculum sp.]MDP1626258.1 hypothetical protein [Parvibaculum sp.]MDP2151576.1 hypothetical protein [Parvibaculum sp.]MDP3329013.1 hypothetical protein [Parvibaculum sp.]